MTRAWFKNPLHLLISFLFLLILFTNIGVTTQQHFVFLAKSFLHGSLSFIDTGFNLSDTSPFNGRYYWPLGPFPAIILMPFVAIFPNFYQGYISFALAFVNFYLIYQICKRLNIDDKRSLILTLFFCFGSIYAPLVALPASYYFAQVIAASLIIFAIWEFLGKKRYLLIGLAIASSIATRITVLPATIFFLYFLFKKPVDSKKILVFVLPIIIGLIFLGFYNIARFGNFLESGYKLQIVYKDSQIRRESGVFSPVHIPANLFYFLLSGPEPVLTNGHILKPPYLTFNAYGLSIFFLSPILFLFFLADYKKEINIIAAITSVITLIPILMYYGIGYKQIGYRYALDFFPFVFLIIAQTSRKISLKVLYPMVLFGVFFAMYFSILYLFGLDVSI